MTGHSRVARSFLILAPFILALTSALTPAFSQTNAAQPAVDTADRSSAYYNFALAHLYAELAGAYGNRGEYVNKAIDAYKQAIKLDPSASYIDEELTEFYVQTGQLDKATTEAQALLKANPSNVNAHKILARIYARLVGDPDQGKVDAAMLKNAIAEYAEIARLDPKDIESLAVLARLYRASHDDPSAEKIYKQILAQDSEDAEALNGLAMVYADRGDTANAIAMLKQAVAQNPDARSVVMLAEFYDQIRDFSNGADTWQKAVELTNDNVRVRRAWTADLLQSGRFDEALKALQTLAGDDPKNAGIQLQIAEILERKHDYPGAAAAIAKARTIDNSVDVRLAEAELMQVQGKGPQAIAALQSILNDTKKDNYSDDEKAQRLRVLDRLGASQQEAGKTQDAISSYRQIADLDPTLASRVELQVIEAYKAAKDFKAARQESDSSLKHFPGERPLILEHASLLSDMAQTDAAVNEVKALPNAAKDRDIQLTIAQIYDKGKKFEEERKVLDVAESLSKTQAEKQGVQFMRGAMYEREKNFDAAEKAFRDVLQNDPNNASALNYLGYMFADRGVRLDEAQQLISKALDLDPGNGAYLDSLGWVYFHQDKLEEAATQLRQALDTIGSDPTVHDHLGDVYFKQNKVREAIQQWEASVSQYKSAAPSDQDPAELAKVTKKLEGARVRVAEKTR
jgi:tetratricopeptide (TPR) repeat protein